MSWRADFGKKFAELTTLDEGAQRVYLALFVDHYPRSFKASQIAEMVGLNRSYTYNILKTLLEHSLITQHEGSPKKYSASSPEVYIERLRTSTQLQMTKITQFKQFVDQEVLPTLLPSQRVSVTQLRQSFFINSRPAFVSYIKNSLKTTDQRILLTIDNELWQEIGKEVEEIASKLVDPQRNVRIIVFSSSAVMDINPGKIVFIEERLDSMQLLFDDQILLFNPYSETNLLSGMGVVIIDPVIAESYKFSITYQFNTYYYDSITLDPTMYIPSALRNEIGIHETLQLLFQLGWKVLDLQTQPEIQYLGLIAPKSSTDTLFRECGLQFVPYHQQDQEEVLTQVYEGAKQVCITIMKDVTKYGGTSFTTDETSEIIHGFSCRKFVAETHLPVPAEHGSFNTPPKNVDIVFDYHGKGAVLVFGLEETNTLKIIQLLSQTS